MSDGSFDGVVLLDRGHSDRLILNLSRDAISAPDSGSGGNVGRERRCRGIAIGLTFCPID